MTVVTTAGDDGYEQWYGKTWRFLRIAMVGLPLALFAAVGEDRFKDAGHCFQSSISGYYYTPAHGFLIGALVAVGVCLFCLKGRNPVENALLNLAGMATPVVAFVPTSPSTRCVSNPIIAERFSNAGNNMFALACLATGALIAIYWFARDKSPTIADALGFGVAAGIVAGEWVLWALFASGVHVYLTWIHNLAAAFLFACLFLVVALHAAVLSPNHKPWWHLRHPNKDAWILILMLASLAAFAILLWVDWTYAVFQIEFCLLSLFIVFWLWETAAEWVYVQRTSLPARLESLTMPAHLRSRPAVGFRRARPSPD